jgi:hypothetical protein
MKTDRKTAQAGAEKKLKKSQFEDNPNFQNGSKKKSTPNIFQSFAWSFNPFANVPLRRESY